MPGKGSGGDGRRQGWAWHCSLPLLLGVVLPQRPSERWPFPEGNSLVQEPPTHVSRTEMGMQTQYLRKCLPGFQDSPKQLFHTGTTYSEPCLKTLVLRWGHSSAVQHLPSTHKALDFIPSTVKISKQANKKKRDYAYKKQDGTGI